MKMEKTTNTLTNILKKTKPDSIGEYVKANAEDVFTQENPFSTYMRECVREKDLRFQEIFLRADLSEGYGYKLISGEKHTRQRDTILKLCLGAGFSLQETQRALKIYGMSPLYARFPRDAVFISAISARIYEIPEINSLLARNGQPLLRGSEEIQND
jgi:hypothetical protein